jgi:hypothetical protein
LANLGVGVVMGIMGISGIIELGSNLLLRWLLEIFIFMEPINNFRNFMNFLELGVLEMSGIL